jgi:hypothetical protein
LSILVQEIVRHIVIHCFNLLSEINPDDHDMKARLDAFSYAQLSLVTMEYGMIQ